MAKSKGRFLGEILGSDGKIEKSKTDAAITAGANLSLAADGTLTTTTLPLSGGTLTGNLNLGDNVKAQFGAGNDLEIFSNGSTALLKAGNTTSDIRIESDNRIVIADRGFNEAFAVFNDDSDVKLYHDGNQKLATTSTGVSVTGSVTSTTGFTTAANTRVQSSSGMLFITGAGAIPFEVGVGSEKMRLTSTGLGIGTQNPGTKLDVTTVANTAGIRVTAPNTTSQSFGATIAAGTNSSDYAFNINNAAGTGILRVRGDGKVGIGTTAPLAPLTVVRGGSPGLSSINARTVALFENNNSAGTTISINAPATGYAGIFFGDDSGEAVGQIKHVNSDNSLQFVTQGAATEMTLKAGKLGIGTTSPAQALEVVKSGFAYVRTRSTSSGFTGFDIGQHSGGAIYLNNRDNTSINFMTNNSQRMQLDNSGNFLVGKTASGIANVGVEARGNGLLFATADGASAVHINRLNSDGELLEFKKDGSVFGDIRASNSTSFTLNARNTGNMIFQTGSTERMRLNSSGLSIGIAASPIAKLTLPLEEANAFKIAFKAASGTGHAGISTVDQSGAGLFIGANAYVNSGGSIIYGRSDHPSSGIYFDGWNGDAMRFYTGASGSPAERGRFDASGNLIVGKTATTFATQGAVINHNGTIDATRSGDAPLYLNRLASDGNIIALYKASVAIGSIGVDNTDNLTISGNSSHAGLNFSDAAVNPYKNGSYANGTIDLGEASSAKFKDLHLNGSVYTDLIRHKDDTDTYIRWPGNNTLAFNTGASERMRLDASGNLLVGKTTASSGTAGHKFSPTGAQESTVNGGLVAYFNRLSSDGEIVRFDKANAQVGSIFNSGTTMGVGSLDTGVLLANNIDAILPWNASTNAERDNVINLGRSIGRFHDAHFGGTVNVGENLVVTGNLTINGTTTTLNTATLNVEDKNITLNYGSGDTSSTADGAGITIQDAVNSTTDASLTWRASDDKFIFSHKLRMFNNLELPDNVKLVAGDGDDLQVYHNGNSYINNQTGVLYIDQNVNDGNLILRSDNGSGSITEYIVCNGGNGSTQLKHYGSTKFATTSTGVSITGKTTFSDDITVGHATTGTHSTTTTATTGTAIASFTKTSFRSAKYLVQVTNTTDSTYHITEILIIHDGTDTYMTEYGSMFTGTAAEATFTSDISGGGLVRLLATPASTDSMTFKVIRQNITV